MLTKVKLKYSEISSFVLSQALQKFAATPTDGRSACRIRNISRQVQDEKKKIMDAYQNEIVSAWGQKDDKGVVIRPEGEPLGFTPLEGKEDEFKTAQDAFGQREVEIECIPLTLNEIKDAKVTAQELEALHGLFMEEPKGPGVPVGLKAVN